MSTVWRAPNGREVDRLARTLVAAKVFRDAGELRETVGAEPWRVLVDDRGDVAVLGRWRDHLSIVSIEALWCPWNGIAAAVREIREIGRAQDLEDVVSPPIPLEDTQPYESAGMRVCTSVMTMSRSGEMAASDAENAEVRIRPAGYADMPVLMQLDEACFEPFWRYDARHMSRFCETGRLALAERGGEAVGYTLCTVDGDEGLLGRLCVLPARRNNGIGRALVREAVSFTSRHGAGRTTLSTQVDNGASQALYRSAGFRDTGRRYAFLRFGTSEGR
jgi:ribosomal-protein-alanine N-acetyltransferase